MFSGGNGPAAIKPASQGAEVAQEVRKQEIDRLFLELEGMWNPASASQPEAKTCYYCIKDSVGLKGKLMFTVESSVHPRLINLPDLQLMVPCPSILDEELKYDQGDINLLAIVNPEVSMAVWLSLSNHRIQDEPDRSLRQDDPDASELCGLLDPDCNREWPGMSLYLGLSIGFARDFFGRD